jgi:hypothetical protein
MDTNGFYGDTFSSGFGDFYTAKRAEPQPPEGIVFSKLQRFLKHKAGITFYSLLAGV